VTNSEKQEEEKCFFGEQRTAFFSFFLKGTKEESSGEEAILFEDVLLTAHTSFGISP
jgi:hypothetical protein